MAIRKLRRELGRVSKFNQSINRHHHMKDHVQSCHLTKFDVLGVNRDEVIDHTNVCNLETALPKTI